MSKSITKKTVAPATSRDNDLITISFPASMMLLSDAMIYTPKDQKHGGTLVRTAEYKSAEWDEFFRVWRGFYRTEYRDPRDGLRGKQCETVADYDETPINGRRRVTATRRGWVMTRKMGSALLDKVGKPYTAPYGKAKPNGTPKPPRKPKATPAVPAAPEAAPMAADAFSN